jgi:sulfite reductase (NADPH) hemoprotein beta-component
MYQYDFYDKALVMQRVAQFRDQVQRRLNDELTEEEFLPLRLQNGLYLQKHAYMLRVAIPYGTLSSVQLSALADIADRYDRGYGHVTTRQNIQFNWVNLEQTPDILEALADVEMHAIQTSGNCIRNVTTDAFAGVSADEAIDPRPFAEIIRQWSTINPEFLFLPRKFKIAVSSTTQDRAAVRSHDVGLYLYKNAINSELAIKVMVGGGLGRTPILSEVLKDDLPWQHILSYLEAVLRVYNRHGRRDNKYKARIKILVKTIGIEAFSEEVDREWQLIKSGPAELTSDEYQRVEQYFKPETYAISSSNELDEYHDHLKNDASFNRWVTQNTHQHKQHDYLSVVISTKYSADSPPGDVNASQMRAVADYAKQYGFGEIRITHEQNLVLPDIKKSDLYSLWEQLKQHHLATANIGLLTDMITCPGGDYCSLANAKSIPVAAAIQQKFDDLDYLHDIGTLSLNISGCMNACGHHHIGNIGILGVDKNGSEWYQITIGGKQGKDSQIGKVIGPSFEAEAVPEVIDKLISTYLSHREQQEQFIDTLNRIGSEPFKNVVYKNEMKVMA